ncbi:hypothetical protein Zm00014a_043500 [Zea mays]|uniref:Uncharacterized protein n=1 Tax=Zea mays TaxID=4577 RepID=A0A3L6FW92_MAIZE|nr:hypothetical protein Zm00014a_043500 [Zea mays]
MALSNDVDAMSAKRGGGGCFLVPVPRALALLPGDDWTPTTLRHVSNSSPSFRLWPIARPSQKKEWHSLPDGWIDRGRKSRVARTFVGVACFIVFMMILSVIGLFRLTRTCFDKSRAAMLPFQTTTKLKANGSKCLKYQRQG